MARASERVCGMRQRPATGCALRAAGRPKRWPLGRTRTARPGLGLTADGLNGSNFRQTHKHGHTSERLSLSLADQRIRGEGRLRSTILQHVQVRMCACRAVCSLPTCLQFRAAQCSVSCWHVTSRRVMQEASAAAAASSRATGRDAQQAVTAATCPYACPSGPWPGCPSDAHGPRWVAWRWRSPWVSRDVICRRLRHASGGQGRRVCAFVMKKSLLF